MKQPALLLHSQLARHAIYSSPPGENNKDKVVTPFIACPPGENNKDKVVTPFIASRPASPQDNGSHERMHRDLKAEATDPPSANLSALQRRFERWRHAFNHQRLHEALDQQFPAEFYQRSARRFGENDRALVYPADHEVKVISTSGFLWHEGHNYHLGEAFAGKRVGVHKNDEGRTEVHFANVYPGNLTYDPHERHRSAAHVTAPPPKPAAGRKSRRTQ
ncbi:MAG: integrase core domain-containing protein [Candidatus Acidiferrales bacterium]